MHRLGSIILGSSLLVACASQPAATTDSDTAASVIDSSDSVDVESDVLFATVDGADSAGVAAATAADIATRIVTNAGLRWQPAGCAVATQTGPSVSITFADCSGPGGLLHVSGTLALSASIAAGQIAVQASGDLDVNASALTFSSSATYSASAAGRSLTVKSSGQGTGPRGTEVDHAGDYTLAWTPASQCRDLTGEFSTSATNGSGSLARSTSIDVERCIGACPTGTVTRAIARGSITVTYDGTSVAKWSSTNGNSGSIQLRCQ